MPGLVADLQFRGLIHQVTDEVVLERLDRGHVVAYIGFDPTAPSLHVGSLLQLCTLRRLQLAGHQPIALAGGGTGMIGDPGGKANERTLLSDAELAENLAGIRVHLGKFLDFTEAAGAARALLLDNGDWLGSLRTVDFLREVGKHFTVNQMVAKESVKARFERPDQGISYTEFSYMLLQAYDFLRLHEDHGCDLQLGGSDQWGNITMGVELIRKRCGDESYGLTSPLVTKADGTKFGKTETETIWLDAGRTSPYRLYQFLLQSEDAVVGAYLRYFTFLSHEEIVALDEEAAAHPERRAAQRALAHEVCVLLHGEDESERAERASRALFGGDVTELDERTLLEVFDDVPSSSVGRAAVDSPDPAGRPVVVDLLSATGLVSSKSEARRAITQGGVTLNNERVGAVDRVVGSEDLLHGRYVVLRKGRREYHLLKVE